jgi:hypothetical protein
MNSSRSFVHSDTLVLVQAFAPYRDMVIRHLPYWQNHQCRVVISSPRDSFCDVPGVECVAHGVDEHAGIKSLDRWKEIMRWLAGQDHAFFLMHESDSICLTGEIPLRYYQQSDTFFSNEAEDNKVPPDQKVFCVAPWFFSYAVLRRFNQALEKVAYRAPYHGDRWVGQVLEEGGIRHQSFSPGITCGTLGLHSRDLKQVCEAVRRGVTMVHGIKTEEVLRVLLRAAGGLQQPAAR